MPKKKQDEDTKELEKMTHINYSVKMQKKR